MICFCRCITDSRISAPEDLRAAGITPVWSSEVNTMTKLKDAIDEKGVIYDVYLMCYYDVI